MFADPIARPAEASTHATENLRLDSSSGSPPTNIATASGDAATTSPSMSAPDFHTERSLSPSPIATSPSYNPASSTSSLNMKSEASPSASGTMEPGTNSGAPMDVEPILEALRNKDRLYVLKLGEQMEALIKERRTRIELTASTSYQRLLVHRCSAYYKLSPETDASTKGIIAVYYRSESQIPSRRICELVPAEESAQPAFQIMRRPHRGREYSQPGSTAGEDADTSDVDASEAGSVGGVSSVASYSTRRFKTIEEREAAYNEARSRIFMGFEEKKDKEKDMSANSSTFSLVSGSGSTSGGRGSSIGDLDDSASSAPTESEWSGPVTRDKRETRRGPGSATSSQRSLRSSGASFGANGSGSSRNSRATSPSFTYPSLYEPPSSTSYEQGQYHPQPPPPPGYPAPYYPHFNHPPPGQPYVGPYYYPPYQYPPPPSQHPDPTTPGGHETMYHPSPPNAAQQPPYGQPYMWGNPSTVGPPTLPPPHIQQQQHQPQPAMPSGHSDAHSPGHMPPPMQNVPPYPYTPGPTPYGYGMPGFYQQPYQPGTPMGPPPPPMPGQMYHATPMPESMPSNGNGMDGHNISRTSSRNSNGHGSVNGRRVNSRTRSAWTYGPGGPSGFTYTPPGAPNGLGATDAFGPRLSTNMRRMSGTSSGGSAGARTPADETSSTASSSTTSSSSRRTFTSTSTSSKHPLPARPDWAVGLKPQHSRHHDHNAASRTMSPARMSGAPSHLPTQQPVLQSNDFPPLSSGPQTRQPVVGGAWTNTSNARVMMPGPQGPANAQGTALVHYPTSQHSSPQVSAAPAPSRLDEQDPAFERPPPKNAELFNPKANGRNSVGINGRSRANTGSSATSLAEKIATITLGDGEGGVVEEPPATMPLLGTGAGELATGIPAGETVIASS